MQEHRWRRRDWVAVGLLAVIAAIFWGNCLWGGKVPVAAIYQRQMLPWAAVSEANGTSRQWDSLLWDSMAQFYPWRLLLHDAAQQGNLPLWNPYQFCGYPFVGNGQSALFYPPNWLYFVVHPKVGMGLSACLHYFLAGLFTFGLARRCHLKTLSALFAALAFSYGGFVVTWIELPTLVNSLIWLPLAWWGVEVICHASDADLGYSEKSTSKPSQIVRGTIMLAAALGLTLLAGHFQIAAYVWVFTALYGLAKLAILLSQRHFHTLRCAAGAVFAAAALAMMLAMTQLLPTLELGSYSSRGAGGPSAAGFEFHRQRALQPLELLTLLQADFLGTPVDGNYPGVSYSEHCAFVGATTLALGLVGLALGWRRKQLWLFAGLAGFALWGAMAGPPAKLLYWGVPKLGQAGGFSRLLSVWTVAAALTGGAGLQVLIDRLHTGKAPAKVIGLLALALLGIELLPWAYRFNPRAEATFVYPETAAIRTLREVTGDRRYVALNDRRAWGLRDVPTGVVLPPNAATVYQVRCVDGYDSLFPLLYRRYAAECEGADPSPLANGNMILTEKASEWLGAAVTTVVAADDGRWLANANRWNGEGVQINFHTTPQHFSRASIWLPAKNMPATIVEDDLNRVRLDVRQKMSETASQSGQQPELRLYDTVYPGWYAWVDGRERAIEAVNETIPAGTKVFRQVKLQSQDKTIDFVYYPASVVCGLFLSLLALLGLIALGMATHRHKAEVAR